MTKAHAYEAVVDSKSSTPRCRLKGYGRDGAPSLYDHCTGFAVPACLFSGYGLLATARTL